MTLAMVHAQQLLACFQTELQAPHPQPILPQHIMLRAGGEVTPLLSTTDDECCRGLGWVRIASVSGVREINDVTSADGCSRRERIVTLEMGTARCAPTSATASQIPTEDRWTAAALLLDEDHGAMERAICCAFADVDDLGVGEYQPFGVDGNCLGATMLVQVAMEACC